MTLAKIDKYLDDCLRWNSVDLFYAFCAAKGIEDPETDVETDEEYAKLENEFCEKVTYSFLQNLVDAISEDVNERINLSF